MITQLRARSRTALLAILMLAGSVPAAYADAPTQPVAEFYNALLDTMHHAQELKAQGRYEKLEPVMLKAFDVSAMARLAFGRVLGSQTPDDQDRIKAALGKLLVASFASEFDDFKGETFTIDDRTADYRGDKMVRTRFHPKGAPVDMNYLVHASNGDWRIVDVYLNGSISQVAVFRDKYMDDLLHGGSSALLVDMKKQTDRDLTGF
jgi:phospholipid transport system substrate-binding protein